MTHDQPASMPDDASGEEGRAGRRVAAEAGPSRFADRFAVEAPVEHERTPHIERTGSPDGGADLAVGAASTPSPDPNQPFASTEASPFPESAVAGPAASSAAPVPNAQPVTPAQSEQGPPVAVPGVMQQSATAGAARAGSPEAPIVFAPIGNETSQGLRPREGRKSFLSPDAVLVPAESGFRGVLGRMGLRFAPSQAELAVRADVAAVSRHWPGPRTIAVANGKGGANKTPTTVMLAAVFARNGGGPVLAWDNNETRGTLGWRTEQGPHEATVLDLLPQTASLLAPSAQSALFARYVHHQTADKFDVLRSKPAVLATQQKITAEDFDALHEVASKYFRLNVIDSGNDETAERWLRMIHYTQQLVIATTTLEEHAEAGALLLEALQDRGGAYGELSRRAVVIVSQSDKNGSQTQAQSIASGFDDLARRAVTIPFDIALLKGRIRFSALRPATQRAWLAAAAAVAEGL